MCQRKINQLPLRGPQMGDPAHNTGTCPDWESNWQHFSSQASVQSTEQHQAEQDVIDYILYAILSIPLEEQCLIGLTNKHMCL